MKKFLSIFILIVALLIPSGSTAQTSMTPKPVIVAPCLSLSSTNLRYRSTDVQTRGEVSILQDFLRSEGYLDSASTGFFGKLTLTAVKKFQADSSIESTGYVGPLTRARINQVSCGTFTTEPQVEASIKAKDASIQAYLSQIRVAAELAYDKGGNSYATVCSDEFVRNLKSAAEEKARREGTCLNTPTTWMVHISLVSDPAKLYCVDHTGYAGTKTSKEGSSTCIDVAISDKLTITYPNGGEKFKFGDMFVVNWTPKSSSGSLSVGLYTKDGDGTFCEIGRVPNFTGSFNVTLSKEIYCGSETKALSTGQYIAQIVQIGGTDNDQSDTTFTISN